MDRATGTWNFRFYRGRSQPIHIAAYTNPDATGMPNPLAYGIPLTFYRSQPEADAGDTCLPQPRVGGALVAALYWDWMS